MKISVFTVMTPEFTPEEIVGKLARMGFEGVEWRVVAVLKENEQKTPFWKGNKCTLSLQTLEEKADRIKGMTEEEGHNHHVPILEVGDLMAQHGFQLVSIEECLDSPSHTDPSISQAFSKGKRNPSHSHHKLHQ